MRFGPIATNEAEGAILAHSVRAGALRLPKARRLSAADIAALRDAGVAQVVAAVLDSGDVSEDEAASRLGQVLASPMIVAKPPSTGRVNLHAVADGVLQVKAKAVDAFNAIDPTITLATLPDMATVSAGQMVATVKIIPFAAAEASLEAAITEVRDQTVLALHPFSAMRATLIQTTLQGTKPGVLDKTADVTAARLARSGGEVISEERVVHEETVLAEALRRAQGDIVIVFGASAVSDDRDVIPAAIRSAGGTVVRTGMPVDPGNLLVLGELGGRPVLGAPGCARSPKLNGFDWVLDRIAAGIPVDATSIARMGVGGLLMEIPTRPSPREARPAKNLDVGSVLLAAGRSSRMGGPNKLLARFDGEPLVRRSARRLVASGVSRVVTILGHDASAVRVALEGSQVDVAENADFVTGLASSLKIGVAAFRPIPAGILVALADMPGIDTADYDRMIAVFRRHGGSAVVRATAGGQRGNPVILPAALAERVAELEGDTGARHLIETGGMEIIDVELGEPARLDVDTPDALAAAGGEIVD